MPFTPTHIAAILPISFVGRNYLPFSALATGSMIPDLPIFIPWIHLDYAVTHSIPGLFVACLPLGMTMFLWFQCFAKIPAVALLPKGMRQRLQPHDRVYLGASLAFFGRVSLAIVIGAATHILWDSFTHFGRWGYRLIPRMNRVVFEAGDHTIELYKALQHGSTVLFLPAMAMLAAVWLYRREPNAETAGAGLAPRQRWFWMAVLLLLPNAFALLSCAVQSRQFSSLADFAGTAVTTSIFVLFVLWNLYAVWFHRRFQWQIELA